ncbi:MAG: nicotinamide-nucleotide amidohydrolase family protein [Gammaproteobacteria bacterium]|nr:nicotinamide-nucleotide amidohydrolase family protein [Gammaproteobacteria bacterium]
MVDDDLHQLVLKLAAYLSSNKLVLTTAESCTGGWLAKVLTDIPGSSGWFECGYVTYSNASKIELLGVLPHTLEIWGAVSEQAVREMAEGALRCSRGNLAVSISGVAGPAGGGADKPVGTVWFCWAGLNQRTKVLNRAFRGGRNAVRRQAVVTALEGLLGID